MKSVHTVACVASICICISLIANQPQHGTIKVQWKYAAARGANDCTPGNLNVPCCYEGGKKANCKDIDSLSIEYSEVVVCEKNEYASTLTIAWKHNPSYLSSHCATMYITFKEHQGKQHQPVNIDMQDVFGYNTISSMFVGQDELPHPREWQMIIIGAPKPKECSCK